jgi:cobalt/nickel transport system permease protein
VKLVATLLFVVAVVATPRRALGAFALDAAVLVAVALAAALPAGLVLRRLRIEVPFLAFAALLPVVGRAPRTEVLGLSLSVPGSWAAWEMLAKGTLGVGAAVILGATTPIADLLAGVERLRAPRLLTAITGFMVRYLDVITDEAQRMRVARLSRGYDPRWLWQARALAASSGTLFVRAYGRGERVHLAMLSRGYGGTMPVLHDRPVPRSAWGLAGLAPLAAGLAMVAARASGA